MEWTRCNLCGFDGTEPYREGYDWQLGGSELFRLVRCRRCGLVYLNPRPSPGEIGQYYPADYEPFTRSGDSHSGRLARWGYKRHLNKRCTTVMDRKGSGRLLDVGCATGEFLARMKEYGWQVQGVEPSPAAAEIARQDYGLDVRTGDLGQAYFPDRAFDAITLWDVLEHLHDPSAALTEIHRILDDDGLLILELPNPQSFDASLFGPFWIGLDMPRHLYVFPPAPLAAMLKQSGFRIAARRCASGGYGAFVLSLKNWAQGRANSGMNRLMTGLASNPALQFLLLPYIYLAYGLRRGPEITLFCEKTRA